MTILQRIARFLDPETASACRFDSSMAGLVDEFRNTRASELADLIESRGVRGAQLAACQDELNQWRLYARALEREVMRCGGEMPAAPDDT